MKHKKTKIAALTATTALALTATIALPFLQGKTQEVKLSNNQSEMMDFAAPQTPIEGFAKKFNWNPTEDWKKDKDMSFKENHHQAQVEFHTDSFDHNFKFQVASYNGKIEVLKAGKTVLTISGVNSNLPFKVVQDYRSAGPLIYFFKKKSDRNVLVCLSFTGKKVGKSTPKYIEMGAIKSGSVIENTGWATVTNSRGYWYNVNSKDPRKDIHMMLYAKKADGSIIEREIYFNSKLGGNFITNSPWHKDQTIKDYASFFRNKLRTGISSRENVGVTFDTYEQGKLNTKNNYGYKYGYVHQTSKGVEVKYISDKSTSRVDGSTKLLNSDQKTNSVFQKFAHEIIYMTKDGLVSQTLYGQKKDDRRLVLDKNASPTSEISFVTINRKRYAIYGTKNGTAMLDISQLWINHMPTTKPIIINKGYKKIFDAKYENGHVFIQTSAAQTLSVDWAKFIQIVNAKPKYKLTGSNGLGELTINPQDKRLKARLSKTNNLSNGDIVKIEFLEKKTGKVVNTQDFTIPANKLPTNVIINPTLVKQQPTFSGFFGKAIANVSKTKVPKGTMLKYEVNGKVVTPTNGEITGLKSGQTINLIYTAKTGFLINNKTTELTVPVVVPPLDKDLALTLPTLKQIGNINGQIKIDSSTVLTNPHVTVTYSVAGKNAITTLPTNLTNGDKLTVTYTPKKGYAINGSRKPITRSITIKGKDNIILPTMTPQVTGFAGNAQVTGLTTITTGLIKEITHNGTKVTTMPTNLKATDTLKVTYTPDATHLINGKTTPVVVNIDLTKLQTNITPVLPTTTVTGNNGSGVLTFVTPTNAKYTITASKKTGLSNGDKVTFTFTTSGLNTFNGKTTTTLEYTVKGLLINNVTTITAPTATGVNGKGTLQGLITPPANAKVTYTITTSAKGTTTAKTVTTSTLPTNLKNGQVVVVTYTANKGHLINGKATDTVKVTVQGLLIPVTVPTITTTTSGKISGQATLTNVPKAIAGTTMKITVNGKTVTGIPTNLKTGDKVVITITPDATHVIKGQTKGTPITKTITVGALLKNITSPNPTLNPQGFNKKATITKPADTTKYTVTVSKTKGLTNGDKITFTYTAKVGYTFNGKNTFTVDKTVSGLIDNVSTINLGSNVTTAKHVIKVPLPQGVTAVVTLPNGQTIDIKTNKGFITLPKGVTLKNGQTLKVVYKPAKGLINGAKTLTKNVIVKNIPNDLIVAPLKPTFTGFNKQGTLNVTPPAKTKMLVFVNGKLVAAKNGIPTNLKNGDKVEITLLPLKGNVINGKTQFTSSFIVQGLKDNVNARITLPPVTGTNNHGTFTFTNPNPTNALVTYKINGGSAVNVIPTNLKNGDKVEIILTAKPGFTFNGKQTVSKVLTVSGLDVDITSTLPQAKVTGFNGKGTITKPTDTNEFTVTVDKTSNLSNGDIITYTYTAKPGFTFNGSKTKTSTQTVANLIDNVKTTGSFKLKVIGKSGNATITLPKIPKGTKAVVTLPNGQIVKFVNGKATGVNISNGQVLKLTITPLKGKINGQANIVTNTNVSGLSVDHKVKAPVIAISGVDKKATFTITNPDPTNLTMEIKVNGQVVKVIPTTIKNTDTIEVTLTPKVSIDTVNGNKTLVINKTVSGLSNEVTIPPYTPKFNGFNGQGTIVLPKSTSTYTVTVNKPSNLSNGETITITYTATNGNILIGNKTSKTVDVVVSGLDVNITSTITKPIVGGFNGQGTITKPANGQHFVVTVDKVSGLSNGDTVTYTLTAQPGYTFNGSKTKTVTQTISGLDKDITSALPKAKITGFNKHGSITKPTDTNEFTVTVDKTSNLSNGDIITYTYTAKPGFTFKGNKVKTVSQTVSGLAEDITSKLPQANVTGFNGEGTITKPIDTTEFTVTVDKTSKLSNGDVITYTYTAKPGFTFNGSKTKTSTQTVTGLKTNIVIPSGLKPKIDVVNGKATITLPKMPTGTNGTVTVNGKPVKFVNGKATGVKLKKGDKVSFVITPIKKGQLVNGKPSITKPVVLPVLPKDIKVKIPKATIDSKGNLHVKNPNPTDLTMEIKVNGKKVKGLPTNLKTGDKVDITLTPKNKGDLVNEKPNLQVPTITAKVDSKPKVKPQIKKSVAHHGPNKKSGLSKNMLIALLALIGVGGIIIAGLFIKKLTNNSK